MKTTIIKIAMALVCGIATSAFAVTTGVFGEGSGPLVWFFVGFMALVVMLQAVPAMILFVSMLRALFSPGAKEVTIPKP